MAAQPIQQVPLRQAVAEERIASSSSLEEEIDRFQFEEEETQGLEAEALEQPLLLPKDMEAYRRFSQQELFLSLKKDLAMVCSIIYCPT